MPTLIELYNLIKDDQKSKYTIFCDMDGVLVDFDRGYEDLTGLHTKHSSLQDKQAFWDLLNSKIEEKNKSEFWYWSNLKWMSDGKQLWDYIKPFNPYILTAPSRNPESKEGKIHWVQSNIGPVRKIIFAPAYKKPQYAKSLNILIDDRQDTIDSWTENGGVGIYHTSASNTIKQLKKLGL